MLDIRTNEINFSDALNRALKDEMCEDDNVIIYGEDLRFGGRYGVTAGIFREFGGERIVDFPLHEENFISVAIGLAQSGLRPIVEFTSSVTFMIAMIDIYRAGIWRFVNAAKVYLPIVVRIPFGMGAKRGAELSGDYISMFYNIPGIKIVVPSTPYSAYKLLRHSIKDQNPVLFFEHENLYKEKSFWQSNELEPSLGRARLFRDGHKLVIISYGYMVMRIGNILEERFNSAGILLLDLLTLKPLDKELILKIADKTKKVIIIEEGFVGASIGSYIFSIIQNFSHEIRVVVLGTKNIPLPYGKLAEQVVPTDEEIIHSINSFLC